MFKYLVDIIDVVSPIVTLSFAIYAAINDTKPKDGKLTRQGKIAVWGIIISGIITLIVKGNGLYNKINDQEKQMAKTRFDDSIRSVNDSIRSVFQDSVATDLRESLGQLGMVNIGLSKSLSKQEAISDAQLDLLNETSRMQAPLSPFSLTLLYGYTQEDYLANLFKLIEKIRLEDKFTKHINRRWIYKAINDHPVLKKRLCQAIYSKWTINFNHGKCKANFEIPSANNRDDFELDTSVTLVKYLIYFRSKNALVGINIGGEEKRKYFMHLQLEVENVKTIHINSPDCTSDNMFFSYYDLDHSNVLIQARDNCLIFGLDLKTETSNPKELWLHLSSKDIIVDADSTRYYKKKINLKITD